MVKKHMHPDTMAFRSEMLKNIRDFFYKKEYLEVDTPLLSPLIIPETTIELFKTRMKDPYGTDKELYLLPSPEYWHKKLIASGNSRNFFQMAKAFRNSEQTGPLHNIEFTMLEWYSLNADYRDSLGLAKELLQDISVKINGEFLQFSTMQVREACKRFASLDLDALQEPEKMKAEAERRGHRIPDGESWNDMFNRIWVSEVEPELPDDNPLFLTDYPAQIPCLAKLTPDGRYRQRWELYWKGMELANCYTEETDPGGVKRYMETEGKEKNRSALIKADWDTGFWTNFSTAYPDVSGAALGVDRLIMAFLGCNDISEVIYFPVTD